MDRISKSIATENKMAEFSWLLTKVIADHGHTITLLEAALIAESMPERYDYRAFRKQQDAEFRGMMEAEIERSVKDAVFKVRG